MEPSVTGHTTTGTTSSAGPAGNGATSAPGATGTKSPEELMRDVESMRKSIQDLTAMKGQYETRIKELEAVSASSTPPSDTGDDEYLTRRTAQEVFRKSLDDWQAEQRKALEAEQQRLQVFEEERSQWLGRVTSEAPEASDPTSPVYKKALEILRDPTERLTRQVNGRLLPAYPAAEYDAVMRARARMPFSSPASEKRDGAAFAATGGSSGGPGPGVKGDELSDEDYLKLTPEERVKYKERKFTEKFGTA